MATVDEVVEKYVALRDDVARIESEVKAQTDAIKTKMLLLQGWLMDKATKDGVDSFKTKHGTAFFTTTDFASVADWDEVLKFVREHDAWELLTKGVSKVVVREYLDSTKEVVPGVNYGTKRTLNVRKPGAKAKSETEKE